MFSHAVGKKRAEINDKYFSCCVVVVVDAVAVVVVAKTSSIGHLENMNKK
jgi:hypothetical protein